MSSQANWRRVVLTGGDGVGSDVGPERVRTAERPGDLLCDTIPLPPAPLTVNGDDTSALVAMLDRLETSLRAGLGAGPRSWACPASEPVHLPLGRMAHAFALDPVDLEVLVLAIAPEVDIKFHRMFGTLLGDSRRVRPTVGLAADLLATSPASRLSVTRHLLATSNLVLRGLVRIVPDLADEEAPAVSHRIIPTSQVLRWMLELPVVDAVLGEVLAVPLTDAVGVVLLDGVALAGVADPVLAVRTAEREALYRGGSVEVLHPEALRDRPDVAAMVGGRVSAISRTTLGRLAHSIGTGVGWDDIVVGDATLEGLRRLVDRVSSTSLVLDDWGFARRVLGRGTVAAFAGPPGTGKTLAARIVAGALNRPLYRVDLGQVVDKYVGETQKNLDRLLDSATGTGVILLFDEADALFGRRTEVRDAHDRYANLEIAHLLARLEEYDGLAILTTNLREHLDDAFVRRVATVVPFEFPDLERRREIWERIWPAEAPLEHGVALGDYAGHRLTGAGVRDAMLQAAFFAAAEDPSAAVGARHLDDAVRRELIQSGRAGRAPEQEA